MYVNKSFQIARIILLVFLYCSFAGAQTEEKVEPAPEFENLFNRSEGWTGADGTYSLPFGNEVMWLFSDTFFGKVRQGRRVDFEMLNNSMVLQSKNGLSFLEAPLFTDPEKTGWFWLMDAVETGDKFEILLAHIVQDPTSWLNFRQDGCWYARFRFNADRSKVVVEEYLELPHFGARGKELITWGTAIYEDAIWTYVFGTYDRGPERNLVLARVPRGNLRDTGTWRFWDGTNWVKDKWKSQPLFAGASNESGVYRTANGGFFYVGSNGGLSDAKVVGRYAPALTGPWGEEILLRKPPELTSTIIMYNAKSHPEQSKDGKVLISYNVNTTDLKEVVENADIYRPRFFWWTPTDPGWFPLKTQSDSASSNEN